MKKYTDNEIKHRERLRHQYTGQRRRSKKRGHPYPTYTAKEFADKYYNNPTYLQMYAEYEKQNFELSYCPTIDRKDTTKPYTFDNIQIMTHQENSVKDNKKKAIIETDIFGKEIESFDCAITICRRDNINHGNLTAVLKGKRLTINGRYFSYKN